MSRLGSISDENKARKKRSLGSLSLNCPPLPHTLFEAMRLLESPGLIEHERVVAMAKNDPLVAVRLLKIANSAYYAFASDVGDVERAVRMLGPATVVKIVVGMNVMKLQSTMDGPAGPLFSRLTRHSLATAHLSSWLSRTLIPAGEKQKAFISGLLADFGKIALVYNYPDDAIALYEEPELRTEEEWLAAETELFGCNHHEAALRFADDLGFSKDTRCAIVGDTSDDLPLIVTASDYAVRAFGLHFNLPLSWSDCSEKAVWHDIVARFPYRAGELDELISSIRGHQGETERLVYQLLRRRTDRSPVPRSDQRSHSPGRRRTDSSA